MFKLLIYGLGVTYDKYLNCVKYQELLGNVQVAGVTRNNYNYLYVDSYPFVLIDEIVPEEYDVCVIAAEMGSNSFKEVRNSCLKLGFETDRIIPISAFAIPYFNLDKYLKIQKISIFALNCWGGAYVSLFKSAFFVPFYQYV